MPKSGSLEELTQGTDVDAEFNLENEIDELELDELDLDLKDVDLNNDTNHKTTEQEFDELDVDGEISMDDINIDEQAV
ncbi:hypothetical protein [Psychromonas ossibalaenae]|uniref:hypothetical protein n=1 Tax=Psychromonas ossibalaenae TaxID=444922 RepID=UPI000382C3BF|nr:hypothetical protein [Psychromonas ossibalaenae]